jgi:hypothetical protein
MSQTQRYLVDVTADRFAVDMLQLELEKAIREYVSDWLNYSQDVAVKVSRDA